MNISGIVIRFDDIHPEMNWIIWDQIRDFCLKKNIKPILAVIPDNKDESINIGKYREEFWNQITELQDLGWGIGLHGFQHLYTEKSKGLIGLHERSEFAGLSYNLQHEKIINGLKIFEKNRVKPNLFIAPSHSFDDITISVLSSLGINVISDGFAIAPYTDKSGITWIPCQRWRFGFNKVGIWTICLHPNNWKQKDLDHFKKEVVRYQSRILNFKQVYDYGEGRQKTLIESLLEIILFWVVKSKFRFIKK